MHFLEISTFFVYFLVLCIVVTISYHKQKSDKDFVIGNRSLNFWLTALSAHGSDMSQWLFMAYPALIFTTGIFNIWLAIGLTFFMFLNWQFVAPKLRMGTEKTESITLNTFFEKRFEDQTGTLRLLSTLLTVLFYAFYISAGLVAFGYLVHSIFGLNYFIGIFFGLLVVVAYVFLGGYVTVAWIDLFQGLFLLVVILAIPIYLLWQLGGFAPIFSLLKQNGLSTTLVPDLSFANPLRYSDDQLRMGAWLFWTAPYCHPIHGHQERSRDLQSKISWRYLASFSIGRRYSFWPDRHSHFPSRPLQCGTCLFRSRQSDSLPLFFRTHFMCNHRRRHQRDGRSNPRIGLQHCRRSLQAPIP